MSWSFAERSLSEREYKIELNQIMRVIESEISRRWIIILI